MRSLLLACCTLFLLSPATPASAVINPSILEKAQDRAPEKIVAKILKVKVVKAGQARHVTAHGRVLFVRESRSGLKKGQRITIKYSSRVLPTKAKGPKPIPILTKRTVGAYLGGSKGVYSPVARSKSFVSPKKIRRPKPVRRR